MKYGLQKAGMRSVCPQCGGTDIAHGPQARCNACKTGIVPLEMHFSQIKSYKRDIEARRNAHKWSWKRCEEISALWMLVVAIVLLLVFIYLASRPFV